MLSSPLYVAVFTAMAVMARLASLAISKRNESRLRQRGGVEFDPRNTRWLAFAHTLYYLSAALEGWARGTEPTALSLAGVGLWLLSMLALVLVIAELREFWTVKIIIAPTHQLRAGSLYRFFKHPNYLLNIGPELIGFALAMEAWATLVIGLPLYLSILLRRIRVEEAAMAKVFPGYGRS
ncbi:isoprenylcysteine carboxyl methyltransferase family protein [Caldimonas brevitalea]|uniref:Methyltransferase n=1 Tax=Caldimonas brevitalea TaxID=413882 RepID=A0A0G3BD51_9BURK|nr:isoprenylcysteine carboxylmethyltransferase family protein [Caldimonas brevitalea]AKJ27294.1 methyltransferase [Caldimonas brevitalea]